MPIAREVKNGIEVELTISGLKGGHSGTEIVNNGKNATIELARAIYLCSKKVKVVLSDMCGGQKDNVIPNTAKARILVEECDFDKFETVYNEVTSSLKDEYCVCEPNTAFDMKECGRGDVKILTQESSDKVLKVLQLIPNGVQVMSSSIDGLPESSLNLGIMKLEDDWLITSHSVRSSVNQYKRYINDKLNMLFEQFGGSATMRSEYPAWEYRENSYLREVCLSVYKNMYGRNARIEAIHAGLECGILSGKIEDLDMVSFGPDMQDIHTSKERLHIESTKRVYDYLRNIIETIEK